jgi:NADH dehydrogenase (ubiquinone) 1 beta subcomplex subunit 10
VTTELQNSKVISFFTHFEHSLILARSSARIAARDAHVRESWVRAMEARIVRDQLQSCYRIEGVNHYETCRELSEKYTTLLRENRVCFSTLLGVLH